MVSGALDRLHYEKDPCVKYDIGCKLWIYLHRDRSEEEFGMRPLGMCPARPGTLLPLYSNSIILLLGSQAQQDFRGRTWPSSKALTLNESTCITVLRLNLC